MKIPKLIVLILLSALLVACLVNAAPDADYADLGPKLTKLTKAVESKVHYNQECTAKMTDKEALYYAIAHDPGLLEPFTDLTVKVSQQNRHAILLVCTPDGVTAIFEDAGCTAGLDWTWERDTPKPCVFTLKVCDDKGAAGMR